MVDEQKRSAPLYKKWWWVWTIVIVLLAGACTTNNTGDDPAQKNDPDSVQTTGEPANDPVTEPVVDPIIVSAGTLISELEANALKASNSYKDKYVEVSGKVSNIDAGGEYFSIEPTESDFNLIDITIMITEEQQNVVAELTTGQQVVVTGTITSIGEFLGYAIEAEDIKI